MKLFFYDAAPPGRVACSRLVAALALTFHLLVWLPVRADEVKAPVLPLAPGNGARAGEAGASAVPELLQAVQAAPPGAPAVVVALADDWNTKGDWLGRYGREGAVLCAMLSPRDYVWGAGAQPMRYNLRPTAQYPARDGQRAALLGSLGGDRRSALVGNAARLLRQSRAPGLRQTRSEPPPIRGR